MGFIDILFSILVIVLAVFITKILGNRVLLKKKKRYHPIGGTVFHLLLNFSRLHHYLTDLTCKHTSFRLLDLFGSIVYTADPANVEHILKTTLRTMACEIRNRVISNLQKFHTEPNFPNSFPVFLVSHENSGGKGLTLGWGAWIWRLHLDSCGFGQKTGWYHYSILTDLLGDGIFTVDGEKWQHQRKVSSNEFSTRLLRDFSSEVFRSNAAKLAHTLSQVAASNEIIDIQDQFKKASLHSVFKVILGVELDSMCGTNEEGTRFSKAFDEASTITLYWYVDIFWKIKRFLNIGSEAVLRQSIKVIDEFVYKLIRSKMELESKHGPPMKQGDILSRFLELKETNPKSLRDIVLSFMIAGKDTTASTLSWFVYMLCKHPHIQEKIAHEVREAAGTDNSTPDEIAASITEEALEKMQYLHAALAETLRLYPAVPVEGKLCFSDDTWPDGFSVRRGDAVSYQPYAMGRMKFLWGDDDGKICLSDDTWPDGYSVKRGDTVFYHPYAMGRMKFLWGDDAEEFRPERWLDGDGIFRQESSFKFTAFNVRKKLLLLSTTYSENILKKALRNNSFDSWMPKKCVEKRNCKTIIK
ncbi:cytochrome P450 704C1-like [Malania oleifera]|uniref:cytochrome P450 704C1-like n=1 Tax=Malania oleifera TaxID=397392 RepID=UPI0025AECB74|nr:cytochrome P450 704C1-like [Malania oleifera]